MIVYVDGSASTQDDGVHEALMDATEKYIDTSSPSPRSTGSTTIRSGRS